MNGMDAGIPALDIDPFSRAFLQDPLPDHERLREAGPVAYLPRYGVFAVAYAVRIAATVPDARVLDGAGHMPHLERPGRFDAAVAEFPSWD